MEQLELFPNDMLRFVEEMSSEEFLKLRERNTPEFYRIAELRHLIQGRKSAISAIERKFKHSIIGLV
jgi:hypothetical protein